MSVIATKPVALGPVLVVLLIVALVRFASADPVDVEIGATAPAGPADGATAQSFTISGHAIEPMSPGVLAPLDLTFMNGHDSPITVTDLTVTIQSVGAPNADAAHACGLDDFVLHQATNSLSFTLAANGSSTFGRLGLDRAWWPSVGMLDRPVDQDGCKGATLTLAYAASGAVQP